MTSTDGLSLEQVQAQWRESQKLLDELRVRLESLANASQSAASAASSIQGSERALGDILSAQARMSQDFTRAYDSSITALNAVTDLTKAGNLNHLSSQIQELAVALRASESADGEARVQQNEKLDALTQRLTAIEELLKSSGDVSKALAAKEQELHNLRNSVNRAIANLPSRFQSKFRENLP